MVIFGTNLALGGLLSAATPEQFAEWGPQCIGDAANPKLGGAFCVSEPDAGSDVSNLRTRARYDEATDEWVLNGQKAWITNGGEWPQCTSWSPPSTPPNSNPADRPPS